MIALCSSCKAFKLIQGVVFLCLMWYSFRNKLFSCKYYVHLNVMLLRGNLGRRLQCRSPLLSGKHFTSINTAALLLIWQIPSCHRLHQSFPLSPESFDSVTEDHDEALALSWGKTDEEQEKSCFSFSLHD